MVDVVLKIGIFIGVGWVAKWRYISTQMKGGFFSCVIRSQLQLCYDESKLDFQGNTKRASDSRKQVFWLLLSNGAELLPKAQHHCYNTALIFIRRVGVVPIYEYQCEACSQTVEKLQKISDAPLVDCEACGKPRLKKMISSAGFRLKGQGWYETDFKSTGQKNLATSSSS